MRCRRICNVCLWHELSEGKPLQETANLVLLPSFGLYMHGFKKSMTRHAAPKLCRFQTSSWFSRCQQKKNEDMGPRHHAANVHRHGVVSSKQWRADQLLTIDTALVARARFVAAVARQSNINEEAFHAPARVGGTGQIFVEDSESMRPENGMVVLMMSTYDVILCGSLLRGERSCLSLHESRSWRTA